MNKETFIECKTRVFGCGIVNRLDLLEILFDARQKVIDRKDEEIKELELEQVEHIKCLSESHTEVWKSKIKALDDHITILKTVNEQWGQDCLIQRERRVLAEDILDKMIRLPLTQYSPIKHAKDHFKKYEEINMEVQTSEAKLVSDPIENHDKQRIKELEVELQGANDALSDLIENNEGHEIDHADIKLHSTMDASVWADEFMRINEDNMSDVDRETMIAWFANAIMCGHDTALRS